MIDRNVILATAKERGVPATELIVLARQNDPFYVGMPSQIRDAKWFADIWSEWGEPGKHLREIHYDISTRSLVPVITPKEAAEYENTKSWWQYLQQAGKCARLLGYVDPEEIGDSYTPPMMRFADAITSTGPEIETLPGYGVALLPEVPDLGSLDDADIADFVTSGYEFAADGPHVEIWSEKSSVTRHIEHLCRRYRVNLLPAKGYMTYNAIISFLRRAELSGRAGRLLYISDFDYSGNNMPVQVARLIEFWQRHDNYPEFHDIDIRIHQLAITVEQVKQYGLPLKDVPADKMNGRHVEWMDQSDGIVEVEAINPYLAEITRTALRQYRDQTVAYRAQKVNDELIEHLDEIRDEKLDEHGINSLLDDYEQLQKEIGELADEFAELSRPFQSRIDGFQAKYDVLRDDLQRANDKLLTSLQHEIEAFNLYDYQLPDPELPDEPPAIYDSRRDYHEQLSAYQAHRNNGNAQRMIT